MLRKSEAIGKVILVLLLTIIMPCTKNPIGNPYPPRTGLYTANLGITGIKVDVANASGKYRMITFDVQWGNNWRTSNCPDNWDAAWVFVKYQTGDGEWRHATLSQVATDHIAPAGVTLDSQSDGKGVFIRRGESGAGNFSARGVALRWNYGSDYVGNDARVNVKVFGLEMVYIPEGSFYAGDNGASNAALTKGSNDKRPWFITSENAINVTGTATDGYYYTSSKDFWNDRWNASEDVTGTVFTIPADFPKGFRAIYCMKYEMTQQQYVDFLNALTDTQAANRYDRANYNKYGYTILEKNGVYSTEHPNRACGFLSPADSYAYADWSGLRPMTELEFEKICRGSGNLAVDLEFAWGTTYCKNAIAAQGTESDREYITNSGANCYYSEGSFRGLFPLDVGIFAGLGKSRENSGAAFYGVMEMGTNLSELCISIGNGYGRVFTYRNGNGQLTPDGFADESNWPPRDGKGGGYRGGCLALERHYMCTSSRLEAAVEIDHTHRHIPWGFRGVRTILF